MTCMAVQVPVHFDGHNINIITEDSPSTVKTRANKTSQNRNSTTNTMSSPLPIHPPTEPSTNSPPTAVISLISDNKSTRSSLILNAHATPNSPAPATAATAVTAVVPVQNQPLDTFLGDFKDEEMMDAAEYDSAQEERASLFKTELCREWSTSGWCFYNKRCSFAHGLQELRPVFRSKKWRTKRCRNWHTTGYCPYEHRCQFLHDQSPPRRIQDYSSTSTQAVTAAQQRMQPLYFHYQVEDPNRERDTADEHKISVDSAKVSDGGKEEQKTEESVLPLNIKSDERPVMEKVAQNGSYLTLKAVSPMVEKTLDKRIKKKDDLIIKPFNPLLQSYPPMNNATGISSSVPVLADMYHPNRELTNAQIADYHYWQQLQQQNVANEILASCGVEQIRRILASDPELCRRLNASQAFINQLNSIRPTIGDYTANTTPMKDGKSFEELISLLPDIKTHSISNEMITGDVQPLGNATFIDPVLLQNLLKTPNEQSLHMPPFNNLLSVPNTLPPMSVPNVSASVNFSEWEALALASIGNNMSAHVSNVNIMPSVPNSIPVLPPSQSLYATTQVTQTDVNRIKNLLMTDMSPGASPITVAPVPRVDTVGNHLLPPTLGFGGSEYYTTNVGQQFFSDAQRNGYYY